MPTWWQRNSVGHRNPGDTVDIADAHLTVRTVKDDPGRRIHVERETEP